MSRSETTVVIRCPETGKLHKITKIVPYKGGGFAALMPYHSARSGYLAKMPVDYKRWGEQEHSLTEAVAFSVDDRVKFSYHLDGFAQFSGEIKGAIIS